MKRWEEFYRFVTFYCLWATASVAVAQPSETTTWSVEVTGPCAEVPGFSEAVADAVPVAVRQPAEQAEMRVQVATRQKPTAGAEVSVFDSILEAPAGSRTLDSQEPGCADLQSQLILVVGILVEAGRGAPVAPPLAPPPEPPPEEPTPPKKEGVSRVRPKRSLRVGPPRTHVLGLVATAGWGLLPGGYPGAELRWSVTTRKGLPVRLAGAFEGPGTQGLDPGRAKLFSGRATLALCPEWPWGAVRVGACGVLGIGATRARTSGLGEDLVSQAETFVLGAEGFIAVPLAGPLELVVGMQTLIVPYRPPFGYEDVDESFVEVFRPSPLTIRGHGGLQLRFQ